MKKRNIISIIVIGVSLMFSCSKPIVMGGYEVVPLPQEISLDQGEGFVIDPEVKIVYSEKSVAMKTNAWHLAALLKQATGNTLEITEDSETGKGIYLELDTTISSPEGYRIVTDREKVQVQASSAAGIFYGIQTLYKALPVFDKDKEQAAWPAGKILDSPRFSYRGVMLDVGRHYFPVDYLKQFMDMLALHHINTFHWHLTEDQGWRIEIKKYPELTKIGSKRKETLVDWQTKEMDGLPYEGYYTQEEIREVVAYAAERFITVIPEIDLPGHMTAALASYPHLGCTGGPYEVATTFGVFSEVLCAGNEQTLQFVKDVLTEVMDLFPSIYIHIGGDECPKERWKMCPKCQAMIRKQGILPMLGRTAENQLQTWFMTQVESFIREHGRRMIGWDEVLEGGMPPDATIMSWRGIEGGIEAAKKKHHVIMTPINYLYFSNPRILKLQGLETVKRVYQFDPVPDVLSTDEQQYILGAQASIWTEWIKDTSRLEYVTLPRLAAAAEIFWTSLRQKEVNYFLERLSRMLNIYTQRGYEYRQDTYEPYPQSEKVLY